jgi:hypothetical protein
MFNESSEYLAEVARRFLEEHPDVRHAQEQFGLSLHQYRQALATQQKPVLSNGTSTMQGIGIWKVGKRSRMR